MRLVFWILLLANLLLFVWGQGFFAAKQGGREPERLQRQLEADKLRILKDIALPTDPPPAAASKGAAPAGPPPLCRRLEWLSADEAATLRSAVTALPGWEAGQPVPRSEAPTHWVLIPELANRPLAERKKGELDKLGIKEGEIVETATSGPFAISLGLFRSQQLAEEFLQSLAKKGARSARLIQRTTPPAKFAIELRAPAEELDRKVPGLLPPQAQVKLVDCAAP